MKKLIVFLLIGLYIIPTFGVTISVHYCGGKINSISILELGSHKGCCSEKGMNMNCCKDKKISIKKAISEEQITKILQSKHIGIDQAIIVFKIVFFSNNTKDRGNWIQFSNYSPSINTKHPIFLRNRSILI